MKYGWQAPNRSLLLLAPATADVPVSFSDRLDDPAYHLRLLADMQRLRGRVYLQDGAINANDLTVDGRHQSSLDERSWHLLSLDDRGQVAGCVRLLPHSVSASFDHLFASHSALAHNPVWGPALRVCIERERTLAAKAGVPFLEAGGWALTDELRHTTEAIRLALGLFAFGQLLGGAIAITTATMRNHSATMLRRIGGRPLADNGNELPSYFDPQYGCEMAVLRFDTESYARKYHTMITELRNQLSITPVVTCRRSTVPMTVYAGTARAGQLVSSSLGISYDQWRFSIEHSAMYGRLSADLRMAGQTRAASANG